MFDKLKGLAGLAGLMKDLPRIRARLEEVRRRLGERRLSAERGGGAVRVTVTGLLRVESIDLARAIHAGVDGASQATDRDVAAGMIADAVNDALDQARRAAEREFSQAAEELGLPLPPGALSGLIG